jgi:hypothetical protein
MGEDDSLCLQFIFVCIMLLARSQIIFLQSIEYNLEAEDILYPATNCGQPCSLLTRVVHFF